MRKFLSISIILITGILSSNSSYCQTNDIGITAILNPVNGCGNDSTQVKVAVSNFGSATQASFGINVDITGGITTTLSSTITSLTGGAADTVIIGTFNILSGGTFNLSSYTTLSSDQNNLNDTVKVTGITIDTIPIIITSNIPNVCDGSNAFSLNYASPTGGTYSGTAISFGLFVPSSGSVGNNLVIYKFTDGNNCTDTAITLITINALPITRITTPASICLNDTVIKISGGAPIGGTYRINGVLDSILKPLTAGLDTVTYTYTDANNCTNVSTGFIRVDSVTQASFVSIADVCIGGNAVSLNQGSPFGGTYIGNSVSAGNYTPVMVTTDTLTYIFENRDGCIDTVMQTVTVNGLPVVSISVLSAICENAGSLMLAGGTPLGGVYSGGSVTNGGFNPAIDGAGVDTINYLFTDANNCSNTAKQSIEVFAAPTSAISAIAAFCNNDNARILTEGSPAGGTYSGTGLTGSNFDPSMGVVGNNAISYIATNANCADTAIAIISIEAVPVFNLTGTLTGCGKAIPVVKTDILGMSFLWSTGSTDDSISVATTVKITVTVTDNSGAANCSAKDSADVVYDEECAGINAYNSNVEVSIYPNPSNGSFIIKLTDINETEVNIDVISANGQVVYSSTEVLNGQILRSKISLENIESGLYVVRIKGERTTVVERITISK